MQAKELGYTEPDPRDDLAGMDVARKVTILARCVLRSAQSHAHPGVLEQAPLELQRLLQIWSRPCACVCCHLVHEKCPLSSVSLQPLLKHSAYMSMHLLKRLDDVQGDGHDGGAVRCASAQPGARAAA